MMTTMGDYLEPDDSNEDTSQKCPSCGAAILPDADVCPACGTELVEKIDLDMVEVEDENFENNMVNEKSAGKSLVEEDKKVREPAPTPRKPAPQAAPEKTAPSPTKKADEKPRESPVETRAKFMFNGTIILLALGVFDLIVSIIKMKILYFWLGVCAGNLIVILYIIGKAYSLYSAASREVSSHESKQVSRVFIGLAIMLVVPIHETYNIYPMGYYSAPWGMLNMFLLLIGAVYCTTGILFSRERIGYFGIWSAGASVLIISPPTHLISLFHPLLNVGWFHETLAVMSGTVIAMSFALKKYRDEQYREYDEKMKKGHEAYSQQRYEEAIKNYDRCIVLAHTLYGHRCYNPDVPISRMRLPAEYVSPWLSKGRALMRLGNYRKACAIFELILEIEPSNPYALTDKARCLMELGEMDYALETINKAASINPHDPGIASLRAKILETVRGMEEMEGEEEIEEEIEDEEIENMDEVEERDEIEDMEEVDELEEV